MDVSVPAGIAIALGLLLLMEVMAYAAHRWIMHGPMWFWHKSHHEPRTGPLEKNDWFAVIFAFVSVALIFAGTQLMLGTAFTWMGVGVIGYGLVYFLFHDVLVHRRIAHGIVPKNRYLKRIVQAHRLHHAVKAKEGTVSFGFLYAPPVKALAAELKRARASSTAPRGGARPPTTEPA